MGRLRQWFRYIPWLIPVGLLLLQLPFVEADPDLYLSHSRDAHTDEGLNTSQVRNFVNGYGISAWECDNLVKNPLFNTLLAPPLLVFGTNLPVARLTVVFFVIGIIAWLMRYDALRMPLVLFSVLGMTQFHVFQYAHFSMAEMCATISQLAAVALLGLYLHRRKQGFLIGAVLFVTAAWYFKIQFAYFIIYVPLALKLDFFFQWIRKKAFPKKVFFHGLKAAGLLVLSVGIYYVGWYLQVKGAFDLVMRDQTGGRFANWKNWQDIVVENYMRAFPTPQVQPLFYVMLACIAVGIFLLFFFKKSTKATETHYSGLLNIVWGLSLGWVLMETHKLWIHHLPSRYLVSGYTAAGFFIAVTLSMGIYTYFKNRRLWNAGRFTGIFSMLLGFFLLCNHGIQYVRLLERRTYEIRSVNQYFQSKNLTRGTVIGPWAPTATWGTTLKAVPVWKDYLNFVDIQASFHPVAVLSEPKEEDSNQAFQSDGYDIKTAALETHSWLIGKWTVNVYWMGE